MVFGLVLALFLENMLAVLFARIGVSDVDVVEGLGWQVSTLLGVIMSAATLVAAWMNPRGQQLSLEVAAELMKVTWPSWDETRVATFAVIIASAIAAVVLFGIDTVAAKLMVDWLPVLWGKL